MRCDGNLPSGLGPNFGCVATLAGVPTVLYCSHIDYRSVVTVTSCRARVRRSRKVVTVDAVYAVAMAERISDEVGIREFKAQLSELVGRVQFRGEVIAVTKNKRRVAVLVPAAWYDAVIRLDEMAQLLRERDPDLFAALMTESRGNVTT